MPCKFSHLTYGEQVTITFTGDANCMNCGASIKEFMPSVQATYAGHVKDYDLFDLLKGFYCPSCGKFINGYRERCGEFGGLEVSIKELQESK